MGSKMQATLGFLVLFLPDGYAILMRPNKGKTAVNGCHYPGDIAVMYTPYCGDGAARASCYYMRHLIFSQCNVTLLTCTISGGYCTCNIFPLTTLPPIENCIASFRKVNALITELKGSRRENI